MLMPDMDGQTFAQSVRERTPDAHIVLLTSGTMPAGDAAKVFDARLLKPYRQSQLFDALTRITAMQTAAKPAQAEPVVEVKNQLILVADDNAVNLKVALAMLGRRGYEAATALNGRAAVDLAAHSLRADAKPFAAVLMDANMPVMAGFEATRLILSAHGHSAPPIIALTASVLEEDRQRCIDAGMLEFLPTPLRIDELSEALVRYAVPLHRALKTIDPGTTTTGAKVLNPIETQVVLMNWSRLELLKDFEDEERSMTREVTALFISDAPQSVGRCLLCTGAVVHARRLAKRRYQPSGIGGRVNA
jgi:CheY-like chemotaxis protein